MDGVAPSERSARQKKENFVIKREISWERNPF
jgi:hypothetical protein